MLTIATRPSVGRMCPSVPRKAPAEVAAIVVATEYARALCHQWCLVSLW
jgi:hypothetical protein